MYESTGMVRHVWCQAKEHGHCALPTAATVAKAVTLPSPLPCPVQVPLTLLQGALAQQGVDKDVEELQCIVANLIVRDYVRGYIAFKQGVVVVSKGQPFPAPSEKWLRDPI